MPTMDKLNDEITKTAEKLAQLKRQKRDKEARDNKKQDKLQTRRKIWIGLTVLSYFPQLEKLQPKRTKAENNTEFSTLAAFCSVLAADKETVARLETQAQQKIAAQQLQSNTAAPLDNQ